ARRIDQADDRQSKFCRQPHAIERLTIALRVRAAEHALAALFKGVALLMADEHYAVVAEPCEPRAKRAVVANGAVTVQLHKLVKYQVDVVQRLWSFEVPGDF